MLKNQGGVGGNATGYESASDVSFRERGIAKGVKHPNQIDNKKK